MLEKSKQSLQRLVEYLEENGMAVGHIQIFPSAEADAENRKSPRQFCFVRDSETGMIYCAQALECVSEEVRTGLLLHEVVHLFLDVGGKLGEVKVDTWILASLPEAGYKYKDHTYYNEQLEPKLAFNVQHVRLKFVRLLENYDA